MAKLPNIVVVSMQSLLLNGQFWNFARFELTMIPISDTKHSTDVMNTKIAPIKFFFKPNIVLCL